MKLYVLDESDKRILEALYEQLAGSGSLTSTPGGLAAIPRASSVALPSSPDRSFSFWAKITGAAVLGDNKWQYSWTEQERTATGFQDLAGGRSGTTTAGFAINAVEANNSATGVQGNGYNIDGQIFTDNAGIGLKEIRGDPPRRMWVDVDNEGNVAYTFEGDNAIDGSCSDNPGVAFEVI